MVVQDDSFSSDGFVFGGSESEKQETTGPSEVSSPKKRREIGDGAKLNDYK